jgi:fructose-specific phosphotransferase system component IIB
MGIKNTLKSEDVAGIKEDLSLIGKKMSYMHFAQMRRLMRKVKEALADKERRLKARVSSGPGKQRESGHMEGQDKTTRPTGATESLDIPESWGAPSTMFAARGSGRIG